MGAYRIEFLPDCQGPSWLVVGPETPRRIVRVGRFDASSNNVLGQSACTISTDVVASTLLIRPKMLCCRVTTTLHLVVARPEGFEPPTC